jgi:hypothetical protein
VSFISYVNNALVSVPVTAKPSKSPNTSFSSLIASEIHAMSVVQSQSSHVDITTKQILQASGHTANADTKIDPSQIFPNLTLPVNWKTSGHPERSHVDRTADKLAAGIMYLPVQKVNADVKADPSPTSKHNSIDIAGLVNFARPNARVVMASSQAGPATVGVGNNPRVFVSERTASSHAWESLQNGRKGGLLAGGIIAGVSVQI